MNLVITLLCSCWLLVALTSPAQADVIGSLALALGTAFGTTAAVGTVIVQIGASALSYGLSLVQQRKALRNARYSGFATLTTTKGGTDPQGTVAGLGVTAGHVVYRNSHGPKNRYYTVVIELSDAPGLTLDRLIIDNDYSEIGPDSHPKYGQVIEAKRTKKGTPRGWLR